MVWPVRPNPSHGALCLGRWGRYRFFIDEPAYGRGPDLEPSSAQMLSNLLFPELGTKDFEATDEVSNIVREFVYGLLGSHESSGSLFVKAAHPVGDRGFGDLEALGNLGSGPALGGPELKDSHSLDRSVVGPSVGREAEHACIFDPQLFLQKTIVLLELIDVLLEANPGTSGRRS